MTKFSFLVASTYCAKCVFICLIICCPVCNVTNFEINLSFLIKLFLYITTKSGRDYSRNIFWAAIAPWEAVSHLRVQMHSPGRIHWQNITLQVFLTSHNRTFWTVVTIYHNLERSWIFSSTRMYTILWFRPPNYMRSKSIKRCPICSRKASLRTKMWISQEPK